MKTIRTKVYQFNELNEQAKQTAIENYRNSHNDDMQFSYDEAYETVKKFNDVFNINEGRTSWLDYSINHIDDSILELSGLRLQKYIWNNFNKDLFKPKYLGCIGDNKVIKHRMSKTHYYDMKKGARVNSSNFIYSNIQKDNSCVLTGVCYDDDMLQPIYEYLDKKDFSNDTTNFDSLIGDCFYAIEKSLENEQDYRNSDSYIIEQIEENSLEFLAGGQLFNY